MQTRRQRALELAMNPSDQSSTYSADTSPLDSFSSLFSTQSVISGISSPTESLSSTSTTVSVDTVKPKEHQPLATPMDDPTTLLKSISDKAKAADVDPTTSYTHC